MEVLEYFLEPLKEGYTFQKSFILFSLFAILSLLVWEVLKRMKIKIDSKFSLNVSLFVAGGATFRVLRDHHLITSNLFVTPNIYLLFSFVFLSLFFFFKALGKYCRFNPNKPLFLISIVLATLPLGLLPSFNFFPLLYVFLSLFPFLVILIAFFPSFQNFLVILAQTFDGVVSYVAITFFKGKFIEQHLVGKFILYSQFPFLFPLLKFLVAWIIVSLLDKMKLEAGLRNYVKLIIGGLALATGFRDLLLLLTSTTT